MDWAKSGTVPVYKEKKARKDIKKYFTPTSYSSQKKSSENQSAWYKKEDSV